MTRKSIMTSFVWGLLGLAFGAGATPSFAQVDIHMHVVTGAMESHIGNLTGHSSAGKPLYRRFCIGCHGPSGDGAGENAMWFDTTLGFPKPRDFTLAVFRCRSTPTGALPTDEDLFNNIGRGFYATNMPAWAPLTNQERADLVAFIKTFSPRWEQEKPGTPIIIPPEPPITIQSINNGKELYQKLECWKCHGQAGRGDGPSAITLTDSKDNPIRPYDFAEGSRFKCGTTNHDLYRIFMTGMDGTPMPSFADVVKPQEAWDLVHYLRTLQVSLKTPERNLQTGAGAPLPGPKKPSGETQ